MEEIEFNEFLSLYTNYRPVYGVGKEHIAAAFKELNCDAKGALSRREIKAKLLTTGDAMPEQELNQCVRALMGEEVAFDDIPEEVTAKLFAEEILGFEDYDDAKKV